MAKHEVISLTSTATAVSPAKRNYILRDGCLHDISADAQYAVSGHVMAGSTQLKLLSVASNGRDVPFTNSVPINLAPQDNFHIAGTYEIDPSL